MAVATEVGDRAKQAIALEDLGTYYDRLGQHDKTIEIILPSELDSTEGGGGGREGGREGGRARPHEAEVSVREIGLLLYESRSGRQAIEMERRRWATDNRSARCVGVWEVVSSLSVRPTRHLSFTSSA